MSDRPVSDRPLVVGASGFIGSALCRELLARGESVTAASRHRTPKLDALDRLPHVDFEWRPVDVLDADAVAEAVAGHRRVFHVAGADLHTADADTVLEVNVDGARNVFEACLGAGVDRVVFVSTAGTRFRDGRPATESDLVEPVGAYQESKARAEALAVEYGRRGLDVVTVHPSSVFGPGDEKFTKRILSLALDPEMIASLPGGASFVAVDDVARGVAAAMERGRPGESYLLGGQNLTYREALEIVVAHGGGRMPFVEVPGTAVALAGVAAGVLGRVTGAQVFPYGPQMASLVTRTNFYDSGKAVRELGYEITPLYAHVDAAIEWYRTGRIPSPDVPADTRSAERVHPAK